MHRIIQILMLGIVALSGGLHLGVIQAVAWGGMLWTNAREHDLAVALERTFDGEHPCGLCDFVASASANDTGAPGDTEAPRPRSGPETESLALRLLPVAAIEAPPAPPPTRAGWHEMGRAGASRADAPEVPPPRPSATA